MASETAVTRDLMNQILKVLIDDFPRKNFEELFQLHSELWRLKTEVVRAIKKKDRWNPSIQKLKIALGGHVERPGLGGHKYNQIIIQFSKINETLGKVDVLLSAAIKNGKFDPDIKPSIDLLYKFIKEYRKIQKASLWRGSPIDYLRSRKRNFLLYLFRRQLITLKKENYDKFVQYYNIEREIVAKFTILANKLNLIHQEKVIKNSFGPRLKRTLSVALLTLLFAVPSFAAYAHATDNLRLPEYRYALVDTFNDSQAELDFEQKYGINLFGDYTNDDLAKIESVLSAYGDIGKLDVNHISVFPGKYKGRGTVKAQATHHRTILNNTIRLFSGYIDKAVIDHELAHFRHLSILKTNPGFNSEWLRACGKYNRYDMVFSKNVSRTEMGYHYKADPTGVYIDDWANAASRFGHIDAYGGTSLNEDIAMYVQKIKNNSSPLYIILTDFDIYRAKVNLLYHYKFITYDETKSALSAIDNAEKNVKYRKRT